MARGFGATFGAGAGDRIQTPLTAHATQRTYAGWIYRQSNVGIQRIFDKRLSGAQVELAYTWDDDFVRFERQWSGTAGWRTNTGIATGALTHFALTYDSGSTANSPAFFINGALVGTVAISGVPPSGSAASNSDPYVLGNRGAGDRTLDGWLAEWAVWNRILSGDELAALAKRLSPLHFPLGLASYVPLIRDAFDEAAGAACTVTGTAVQPHVPVIPLPLRNPVQPPPAAPPLTEPVFTTIQDSAVATGFTAGATNVTVGVTAYTPAAGADALIVEFYGQDLQDWAQGNVTATYAGTTVPLIGWARGNLGAGAGWSHGSYVFVLPAPLAVAASGDVVLTYAGPVENSARLRCRVTSVENWDGTAAGAVKFETSASAAAPATFPALTTAAQGERIFTSAAFNASSTNPNPSANAGGLSLQGTMLEDQCGGLSGVMVGGAPGSHAPSFTWGGSTQFAGVAFRMVGTGATAGHYDPNVADAPAELAGAVFGQTHILQPTSPGSLVALDGATAGTIHAAAPASLESAAPLTASAAIVTHDLVPASLQSAPALSAGEAGHFHTLAPSDLSSAAQTARIAGAHFLQLESGGPLELETGEPLELESDAEKGAVGQTHALAPTAVAAAASLPAGAFQQTHPLTAAALQSAAAQSAASFTASPGIGGAFMESTAALTQCIVSVPVIIIAPAAAQSAAQASGAMGGTAIPPVAIDETVYLAPAGSALAAGATNDLDPSGDPLTLEVVGLGVGHADDRLFADGRGYEPRSVVATVEPDGRGIFLAGRGTAQVGQSELLTYEIESISGLRDVGNITAVMAVVVAPAAVTSRSAVQAAALDSPLGYAPASLSAAAQLQAGAIGQTNAMAPRTVSSAAALGVPVLGMTHALTGAAVAAAAQLEGATYSASRNFTAAAVSSAAVLPAAAAVAIKAYQPFSLASATGVAPSAYGTAHAVAPDEAASGAELEPALFAGENELFAEPASSPSLLTPVQLGQTHGFQPLSGDSAAALSRPTPGQTHVMAVQAAASPTSAAVAHIGQEHLLEADPAQSETAATGSATGQVHALSPAAVASASTSSQAQSGTAYNFLPEPLTARAELPAGGLIPSKNFVVASLSSVAQIGAPAAAGQTHSLAPHSVASQAAASAAGAGLVWLPTAILSRAGLASSIATPEHIMTPEAVASTAAAQAGAIGQGHEMVANDMNSAAVVMPPGIANPTRRAVGYRTHESRTGYRRRGRTD